MSETLENQPLLVAALLTTLKEEAERQHARAEALIVERDRYQSALEWLQDHCCCHYATYHGDPLHSERCPMEVALKALHPTAVVESPHSKL
jgi:hypothetical protein